MSALARGDVVALYRAMWRLSRRAFPVVTLQRGRAFVRTQLASSFRKEYEDADAAFFHAFTKLQLMEQSVPVRPGTAEARDAFAVSASFAERAQHAHQRCGGAPIKERVPPPPPVAAAAPRAPAAAPAGDARLRRRGEAGAPADAPQARRATALEQLRSQPLYRAVEPESSHQFWERYNGMVTRAAELRQQAPAKRAADKDAAAAGSASTAARAASSSASEAAPRVVEAAAPRVVAAPAPSPPPPRARAAPSALSGERRVPPPAHAVTPAAIARQHMRHGHDPFHVRRGGSGADAGAGSSADSATSSPQWPRNYLRSLQEGAEAKT